MINTLELGDYKRIAVFRQYLKGSDIYSIAMKLIIYRHMVVESFNLPYLILRSLVG